MARYIDADALKDWSEIVPLTGDGGIDINDFEEYLASMPAADVAPVRRGKWEDKDGGIATCSTCGTRWGVWDVMNFCPNCGAKMDGGDGE